MSKAKIFREMHNENMFILPNAWNAGSAVVFERQGYGAIGTTSAGISYSMGKADGESISFDQLLNRVKEIVEAVDIPVTVDLERGYSEDIKMIQSYVSQLVRCGAVGINIEDGNPDNRSIDGEDYFIRKIRSIVEVRNELGQDFFINARTDAYLLNVDLRNGLLHDTIKRAKALKEAGADGIFIPGALDYETIKELRASIDMPINLYLHEDYSSIDALKDIGINRLSSGSAFARAIYSDLIRYSNELLSNYGDSIVNCNFNYAQANDFFRGGIK